MDKKSLMAVLIVVVGHILLSLLDDSFNLDNFSNANDLARTAIICSKNREVLKYNDKIEHIASRTGCPAFLLRAIVAIECTERDRFQRICEVLFAHVMSRLHDSFNIKMPNLSLGIAQVDFQLATRFYDDAQTTKYTLIVKKLNSISGNLEITAKILSSYLQLNNDQLLSAHYYHYGESDQTNFPTFYDKLVELLINMQECQNGWFSSDQEIISALMSVYYNYDD